MRLLWLASDDPNPLKAIRGIASVYERTPTRCALCQVRLECPISVNGPRRDTPAGIGPARTISSAGRAVAVVVAGSMSRPRAGVNCERDTLRDPPGETALTGLN
jgi:hypothetical protein